MRIESIRRVEIIGRLSDGSDREEKIVYDVTVKDGGKVYFKVCDEIPTEENIDISTFADITLPPTMEEMQMQTLLNTEYLVIISEITNV